jgi:hypothetical protein
VFARNSEVIAVGVGARVTGCEAGLIAAEGNLVDASIVVTRKHRGAGLVMANGIGLAALETAKYCKGVWGSTGVVVAADAVARVTTLAGTFIVVVGLLILVGRSHCGGVSGLGIVLAIHGWGYR